MRIVEEVVLGDAARFTNTAEWQAIDNEIRAAINAVDWPENTGAFVVNPVRKGNGVVAIKANCIESLVRDGWAVEQPFDPFNEGESMAGPLDAQKRFPSGLVLVEWETGNVSSSHRALNKMAHSLARRLSVAGVLIVPMRELAVYLTDRIGNFEEIEPYFPFWDRAAMEHGLIKIFGVSHDGVDETVPLMPKRNDGNGRAYQERINAMREATRDVL